MKPKGKHAQKSNSRPRVDAPSTQTSKDPFAAQTFLVDGLSAVTEYARFKPESILEVLCKPAMDAEVRKLLNISGVEVRVTPMPEKPGIQSPPVQARVKLKALEFHEMEIRLEDREKDIIVALDHITDPRNLGAIVRSAAFFGTREIIAPERRQVLLTQASVATAQGGFALADLVCVTNLGRTLDELKKRDYWIIGTAMDGEPINSLVGTYKKLVIVLGAEDVGISRLIREKCDRLASIPGRASGLDSLNVSVAAGIFLSALATS